MTIKSLHQNLCVITSTARRIELFVTHLVWMLKEWWRRDHIEVADMVADMEVDIVVDM